jgi:hypothetical protein
MKRGEKVLVVGQHRAAARLLSHQGPKTEKGDASTYLRWGGGEGNTHQVCVPRHPLKIYSKCIRTM